MAIRGLYTMREYLLREYLEASRDLTADKPLGTPLCITEALERIEQQSGAAFDPSLVKTFCQTMREQPPQS